jgi:hypothetical protein
VTVVWVLLGAALAAAAVVLVALPFLREPEAADDRLDAPSESALRRLELAEDRDRALAALKELEFDHRTGKIGDDDYRDLVRPFRQSAAAALKALDEHDRRYGPAMRDLEPPETVPEPWPPPDEGTPPPTGPVEEPYPPPDEGTPPSVPPAWEPGPQE